MPGLSRIGAVCVAYLATACGPVEAQTFTPTTEEVAVEVSWAVNHAPFRPSILVLSSVSSPKDCKPGAVEGVTAAVCSFCFTYMTHKGDHLEVSNVTGTVVLKHVLSSRQPNVAPSPGKRGEFAALMETLSLDNPTASAPLPAALQERAGYRPLNTVEQARLFGDMPPQVKDTVRAASYQLTEDISALVGPCKIPPASSR